MNHNKGRVFEEVIGKSQAELELVTARIHGPKRFLLKAFGHASTMKRKEPEDTGLV